MNYSLIGGASYAKGKTRSDFLSVGPWERGWVAQTPWFETGFFYAPNQDWEFGLQLPLFILPATFNFYRRVSDNVGVGAKVGILLSSLSAHFSAYPTRDSFVTFSPGVSLNKFGISSSKNLEPESGASNPQRVQESKLTLNSQIAVGMDLGAADGALLIQYAYAMDGAGIDNSILFDDTLLRHFLKISLGFSF